ncbi:MAG TPA: glycosyltransferase family 2 protein [Candidatus Goldiibacteriota bacterium]|nr:glycosyltransferase family 2 protein [Candidatus Goldiibacteriota bacterium]
MKKYKRLSVIMPVYNEAGTIEKAIKEIEKEKIKSIKIQIIVVDDGSNDGTSDILKKIQKKNKKIKVIFKDKNQGKGSAIRDGLKYADGDYIIFQDADLEYSPEDYNIMLMPILKGYADVVYGSRFLGPHRSFLFWNFVANKFLNFLTNLLYNTTLTDMETCFKLFKSDIIKNIKLRSNSFTIEPEITSKVLKKKVRIYEVPIQYYGRGYEEGKKIKAIDGIKAFFTLLWYRFFD